MSHEVSETVQDEETGKWVNVYGKETEKAGQRLPGTKAHDTVESAVEEAAKRSRDFRDSIDGSFTKEKTPAGKQKKLNRPAEGGVRG